MAGSKDYTRVCEACGTAWLLPKEWATEKAPKERQVRGMSGQRPVRRCIEDDMLDTVKRVVALETERDRYKEISDASIAWQSGRNVTEMRRARKRWQAAVDALNPDE